ncbi:MAG: hypothetical protein EOO77_21875 [Oxalobacteraceae bacterium]|nr:MAG: hypothetical protein EOO77_21875 [Oxalobacteraceae bacterium]
MTVVPAKQSIVNFNETKTITGPFAVTVTPSAGSALTFSFPTPQARWVINHNLGYYVGVKLFTLGGLEVDADTQCMNLNQVRVHFEKPFAGFARVF